MMAMLWGLRAHHMVQGPSIVFAEMDNKKLLTQEIFASGQEPQPYLTLVTHKPQQKHLDHDDINLKKKSMIKMESQGEDEDSPKERLSEQDWDEKDDSHSIKLKVVPASEETSSHEDHQPPQKDHCRSFLSQLVAVPFTNDPEVVSFLSVMLQHSKSRGMVIMVDTKEAHPLEGFARVFMACLLKMLDMTSLAIKLAASVMGQQETVPLPSPLVEMNKLVYDAKVSLIKVLWQYTHARACMRTQPANHMGILFNSGTSGELLYI